ncbi:MAG TPA: hypothetical protein VF510_17310 [Ktedonobacterales bacterium]
MQWQRWLRPTIALAVLALAVALTLFLTLNVWHSGDGDVLEYQSYAQSFWWREPRFQTLPREYPPLALLPFSVTLLAGNGDPQLIFGVCVGALFLLGYLAFLGFSSRGRGLWYAAYLLVGAQGILLARYDLVPALLTLGALWATQRRRFTWAYALLTLGALLKLYPIVLVPVVLTEQAWALYLDMPLDMPLANGMGGTGRISIAQAWRGIVWPLARTFLPWLGLLVAGIMLPMLYSQEGLAALTYVNARPIQVESFPATLLWLRMLSGVPMSVSNTFGSDNWDGGGALAGMLATLSPFALAMGCLIVYWHLAWRRIPVGKAFIACICVVLVTSKVFSTQYLIWVLPLMAEVEGGSIVWVLICLLTFVDYPLIYPFNQPGYTPQWEHGFMLVVALRNTLLVYVILRAMAGSRAGAAKWRLPSKSRPSTAMPPTTGNSRI